MISLILSGGVGSRLWPISREKLPKQFSPLFEKGLFVQTVERLKNFGEVYVCTGESLRALTESSLRRAALPVEKIYYEPQGRNTAPAIALACKDLLNQGRGDEVLGVFPSDHWIKDLEKFTQALSLAEMCANEGQIVTIGITPSEPATGFGYIELAEESYKNAGDLAAKAVRGFKEKPNLEIAKQYLANGNFVWNSGMFVFKVQTMVEAFKQFMPEMWQKIDELAEDLSNLNEVYQVVPKESIDYGIMEKAPNQVNIPCQIGWSDLGSWDDVSEVEKDKLQSPVQQREINASNCFAHSDQKKTVCFSNVDDLIVVDTDDALLITRKGESQSVKDIVEELNSENSPLIVNHEFEYRPWGMYRNLYEEESFKTKVITVDAYQQLSYQSHQKRSETWIVVQGEGEVVLDDRVIPVKKGSVVQVPQQSKHRMRNTGDKALKFIEVQLGEYFGEDDITRFQDDYKRI